jgi:hypothetical protein
MTTADLEEVAYSLFPRKVLTEKGDGAEIIGNLGPTSTDFEVKCRNSASMVGIEDGASGKTARDAARRTRHV